jgi:hypothetical protein
VSWYNETLRKVHILYVSPQWAGERGERFDAREYVQRLRDTGVTLVQVYAKDHHGVCYYPCSLGLPYPRDVMAELQAECHRAGMRIMAYFSVCFDNFALGLHPEWRATDRAGNAPKIGPFFTACPNSGYRAFAIQQLKELVSHAPWDGIWLDIIPLAWGTTPLWLIHSQNFPCYCLGCQRAFQQRFSRMLPLEPTLEERRESFRFMTDSTADFLQEMYGTIRTSLPEAVVTYNAAGAPGDPIDSADLVSIEGHAPNYVRQSFLSRWGRARVKPFEIMTAGAVTGWNGWDVKPASTLELEMSIAAVHCGSMTVGLAPYPSGALEAGWFDAYRPAFRRIEQLEPLVRGAVGVHDVGLVLAAKPASAPAAWSPMYQAAEAAHELLLQEHLLHAVVPEITGLEGYRLVVLANQQALSQAEAALVREYVAAGGHVLITGETGMLDETGRQRDDFALADVMGVHFQSRARLHRAYIRLADPTLAHGIPDMPLAWDQSPIEVVLDGGQILATYCPGEAEVTDATTILWGYPAPAHAPVMPLAVAHQFGQGQCLYLAIDLAVQGFGSLWLRMLGRNILRMLLTDPAITVEAPPSVEVVLNRQGSRCVLHLLNHAAGAADSTPYAFDVHGIRVRLHTRLGDLTSASVVGEDLVLPLQQEAGGAALAVPPLRTQMALVLV